MRQRVQGRPQQWAAQRHPTQQLSHHRRQQKQTKQPKQLSLQERLWTQHRRWIFQSRLGPQSLGSPKPTSYAGLAPVLCQMQLRTCWVFQSRRGPASVAKPTSYAGLAPALCQMMRLHTCVIKSCRHVHATPQVSNATCDVIAFSKVCSMRFACSGSWH